MKFWNVTPPVWQNRQDLKQLEDLDAMREASPMYRSIVLAEQIGIASLVKLHPKKTLWQKIRRRSDGHNPMDK